MAAQDQETKAHTQSYRQFSDPPPHFYDGSTQNVHDVIKIMHEVVYEKYNIFSHF